MRPRRVLTAACLAAFAGVALLGACSAIVGVEDVTLRKDSGATDGYISADTSDRDTNDRPVENVLEVALGLSHTCARKTDLTVKCWGDDTSGQTGTGGTVADAGVVITPSVVNGITDAIRIGSGKSHTCIVHKGGTVACWGDDTDGQLGDGKTNARSNVPVDVPGLSGAVAVACGASFTCAVLETGGVSCWGNGLAGQLGNGAMRSQPSPGAVTGLDHVVAMTAGESHACAVKDDGALFCWGDGFDGQLGNGDQMGRTVPTAVPTITNVAIVAGGARSTCALQKSGAVYCWGENSLGQLGSGAANATPNPSPTVVSGLDAIALRAGSEHACAVTRTGSVVCWGAGDHGQIGDGQPREAGAPTPSPTGVQGITGAVKVGTGGNHSCATTPNAILCWGQNDRGQLGTGSAGDAGSLSPDSVIGAP